MLGAIGWALRLSGDELAYPAAGWLDLDCEALHDPDRGQRVILYTAPPGSPAAEALRLLQVVGLQTMTR